jgi:hypothetical protein
MRAVAKWMMIVIAVPLIILCVLELAVYVGACNQQRKAERLLSAISKLQVGKTQVSDLQRDIFPLDSQFGQGCGSSGHAYSYIANYPAWMLWENEHTPEEIRNFKMKLVPLRGTFFSVSISCHDGLLSGMRVVEMQDAPGWPHPYSDSSTFLSEGSVANEHAADPKPETKDYWIYVQGTALYDGEHLDHLVRGRFISITPDATVEEKRKALEFHLDCFTRFSGCQNVDLILRPSPNRK